MAWKSGKDKGSTGRAGAAIDSIFNHQAWRNFQLIDHWNVLINLWMMAMLVLLSMHELIMTANFVDDVGVSMWVDQTMMQWRKFIFIPDPVINWKQPVGLVPRRFSKTWAWWFIHWYGNNQADGLNCFDVFSHELHSTLSIAGGWFLDKGNASDFKRCDANRCAVWCVTELAPSVSARIRSVQAIDRDRRYRRRISCCAWALPFL